MTFKEDIFFILHFALFRKKCPKTLFRKKRGKNRGRFGKRGKNRGRFGKCAKIGKDLESVAKIGEDLESVAKIEKNSDFLRTFS